MTIRFAGDRADIAAETVAGFLAALAGIDLGGVALFASLRWAAYRAGLAAVHAALDAPIPLPRQQLHHRTNRGSSMTPTVRRQRADHRELAGGWRGSFGSGPPPAVAGHPDLVLARAVRDGILSLAEAALIGSTRLEALSIADAAAARGQSVTAATVARHRAEHRLRRYLTPTPPTTPEPDIDPHHPRTRSASRAGPRATRAAVTDAASGAVTPTGDAAAAPRVAAGPGVGIGDAAMSAVHAVLRTCSRPARRPGSAPGPGRARGRWWCWGWRSR